MDWKPDAYISCDVQKEFVFDLEAPQHLRPWRLRVCGMLPEQVEINDVVSRTSLLALAQVLDYVLDVDWLTLETRYGQLIVGRDYPSDYNEQIDSKIALALDHSLNVDGITFPAARGRCQHTATRSDPFWCSLGKQIDDVERAMAAGEISKKVAIERVVAIMAAQS